MRKKVVLSFAALAVIAVTTLIVISCNKNDNEPVTVTNQILPPNYTPPNPQNSLAPQNVCGCANHAPPGCGTWKNCAKKVLGNALSRTFTINWTSCSGCGGSLPNSSSGTVCYLTDVCDSLQIQLNDLPACLQKCYGTIVCLKAKLTCQGGSYNITFQNGDHTQQVTITGDPHIFVLCEDASGVAMSCDGDLVWN
jgi:hypothetical protein